MNKKKNIIIVLICVLVLGLGGFITYMALKPEGKKTVEVEEKDPIADTEYGKLLTKYFNAWKDYDEETMLSCFHSSFNITIKDHSKEESTLETGYWYTYGDDLKFEDVLKTDPEYKERAYLSESIMQLKKTYNVDIKEYKVITVSFTYSGQGNPSVAPDTGTMLGRNILIVNIDGKWYLTSQPKFIQK